MIKGNELSVSLCCRGIARVSQRGAQSLAGIQQNLKPKPTSFDSTPLQYDYSHYTVKKLDVSAL